jgi:hypothetical protein
MHVRQSVVEGADGSFLIYDNLYCEGPVVGPVSINGQGAVSRSCTLRRIKITDNFYTVPRGSGGWGTGSRDRTDPMYVSASIHTLVEKYFVDTTGWNFGYRVDRNDGFAQAPNNQSHGGYMQGDNSDVTFRDAVISWPAFSMVQARSSGVFERIVGWGQNGPFSVGGTGQLGGTRDQAGNWAYAVDILMTEAGQKDYLRVEDEWAAGEQISNTNWRRQNSDNGTLRIYRPLTTGITGPSKPTHTAGAVSDGSVVWEWISDGTDGGFNSLAIGFNNQNVRTCADRFIVTHTSPGQSIPSPTALGPVGRATTGATDAYKPNSIGQESNLVGSHDYGLVKVYDWVDPSFDLNLAGLDPAALDQTTISQWHDIEYSTSGSDMLDLRSTLRAEGAPWERAESILRFFMGPFGWGGFWTPRTAPATVRFLPRGDGGSPGFRADIRDDWSTTDLPGSVAGDNVDLAGYDVRWNIQPAKPLGTVRFGGGVLNMSAGMLRPAAFADAGTIRMSQGTKLYLDGHEGGVLNVDLTESRFLNSGTARDIDLTARYRSEVVFGYDDASFVIGPGRTVTLLGDVLAGFDGEAGGAANLAVAGTLSFRPGVRLSVSLSKERYEDGRTSTSVKACTPSLGSVVTGRATGATGRVVEYIIVAGSKDAAVDNARAILVLDEVTGVFQSGEPLDGTRNTGILDWPDGILGTVNATPVYTLPRLRNFATGIGGRRRPQVTSSVTLGGVLAVDTTGLVPGLYTLIEADSIVGGFATQPAGVQTGPTAVVLEVT